MRMEYKHTTKQSLNQREKRTRRRKGQRGTTKTTKKKKNNEQNVNKYKPADNYFKCIG